MFQLLSVLIIAIFSGYLLYQMWKNTSVGIWCIFICLIIGEIGRLSFLPIPVLALDAFVIIFCIIWLLKQWYYHKNPILGNLFTPFLLFILFATISLITQGFTLSLSIPEWITSASYLFRLCSYFCIYLIVRNEPLSVNTIVGGILLSSGLLAVLGFIQLWIIPDFTGMQLFGWDPHIGRLLSTWFDPNFIGGFFAGTLLIIVNILAYKKLRTSHKVLLWTILCILLIALYITYSRSAYLFLFTGLFITGIFRSPKILLSGCILLVIFFSFIPRAKERIEDLYGSTFAFLTNSIDYSLDVTAKLRVESWEQALTIFQQYPLLGVGYNTLRYVRINQGMIMQEDVHSGSGSDSSLLTILATTGLVGITIFSFLLFQILKTSWYGYRQKQSPFLSHISFGFFTFILGLLVHSLFVNSFLLPYFLVIVFIGSGSIEQHLFKKTKAF